MPAWRTGSFFFYKYVLLYEPSPLQTEVSVDNRVAQRHRIFWRIVRIVTVILAVGSVARIGRLKYAELRNSELEYLNRVYDCDNNGSWRAFPATCSPDMLHIFVIIFFTALICVMMMALCVAVIYGSAVFCSGGPKLCCCSHLHSPLFELSCFAGVLLAAVILLLSEDAFLALLL